MIVFLSLQGFYVSVLGKQWDLEPFVVARKGTVLDCNLGAAAREVAPGMSLREAKAILRGAPVVEWDPDPYRAIQRQWLDICAEASDIIEPVDQHEAFVDLSAHPQPLEIATSLLAQIDARTGLKVQLGVSQIKWIARHSCGWEIEAVHDLAAFAGAIRVRSLPLPPATANRLEFLGCQTGSDVLRLSRKQLRGQFGDEAHLIIATASGKGPIEAVLPLYPPKSVQAHRAFDGSIEDALEVDRALDDLAKHLSHELKAIDRQGKELQLEVELEGGQTATLKRQFSRAIQSRESLLSALRREWEALEIDKPVGAIQVQMKRLERPREIQQPLTAVRSIESERKLDVMAQGVRQLYGESILQQGSERPEQRRDRLLRTWKDANGWA